MHAGGQQDLIAGVTSVSTGEVTGVNVCPKVVRARVVGSGAVTATVNIYGCLKGESAAGSRVLLGTITLSGTNEAADAFAMDAPWPEMFADLTAISGTSAAVTVSLAY